MSENKDNDILLAQYKVISDQIIHWDDFFWKKSTVFFAFETAAFFGTLKVLIDPTTKVSPTLDGVTLFIYLLASFLGLFMCVVWLRTGIRNREFLNMRFDMGRLIENYFKKQTFSLYKYQQWKTVRTRDSSSHRLEIAMPLVFEYAWVAIVAYLLYHCSTRMSFEVCAYSLENAGYPLLVLLCVIALYLFAKEAWDCSKQKAKTPEQETENSNGESLNNFLIDLSTEWRWSKNRKE